MSSDRKGKGKAKRPRSPTSNIETGTSRSRPRARESSEGLRDTIVADIGAQGGAASDDVHVKLEQEEEVMRETGQGDGGLPTTGTTAWISLILRKIAQHVVEIHGMLCL